MINKKEITEVAKSMLRRHRGLADPQIIHPQREWFIGIGASVLLFSLIVWWSASSYIKHSEASIESSTETVSTETVYREGQVNSALELFDAKSKRYEELVGDESFQPTIVEPVVEVEESVEAVVAEESLPTDEAVVEEVSSDVVEEEVVPAVLE